MPTLPRFDQTDIRRFYDRFGAKQDKQAFYEDPALDALIEHSAFHQAQAILEIGCGTGRLAARLLADHLPASARYVGLDISTTMVRLARERLEPWADRAEIHHASGTSELSGYGTHFDRCVSTYVFDLLNESDIDNTLSAVHGVLPRDGLFCTAALTWGESFPSSLISSIWNRIYRMRPVLVGGCRPISLSHRLPAARWQILHNEIVTGWAIPSEIMVAKSV